MHLMKGIKQLWLIEAHAVVKAFVMAAPSSAVFNLGVIAHEEPAAEQQVWWARPLLILTVLLQVDDVFVRPSVRNLQPPRTLLVGTAISPTRAELGAAVCAAVGCEHAVVCVELESSSSVK